MSALQQPARLQPPRLQRLARRQTQAAVAARREAECACDRPAASPEGHWCPRHNHFIDASSSPGRDLVRPQAPAPAERAADRPSAQLTGSRDFVAGCAAGVCSTVVGHPFDTIKTCMQGDIERQKYKGLTDTYRQLMAEGGKATLTIPSELGYGTSGAHAASTTLASSARGSDL